MIPNNEIVWQSLPFHELSGLLLYEILRLRSEVFVVEQKCAYQDMDYKDLNGLHLCAFEQERLVAYCRILPPGISYADAASIGRIVNAKSIRRRGIGRELVRRALQECRRIHENAPIQISAQLYLKDFYESLGFRQMTEQYLEDDIPHIGMKFNAENMLSDNK